MKYLWLFVGLKKIPSSLIHATFFLLNSRCTAAQSTCPPPLHPTWACRHQTEATARRRRTDGRAGESFPLVTDTNIWRVETRGQMDTGGGESMERGRVMSLLWEQNYHSPLRIHKVFIEVFSRRFVLNQWAILKFPQLDVFLHACQMEAFTLPTGVNTSDISIQRLWSLPVWCWMEWTIKP